MEDKDVSYMGEGLRAHRVIEQSIALLLCYIYRCAIHWSLNMKLLKRIVCSQFFFYSPLVECADIQSYRATASEDFLLNPHGLLVVWIFFCIAFLFVKVFLELGKKYRRKCMEVDIKTLCRVLFYFLEAA